MSPDEVLVTIAAVGVGVGGWCWRLYTAGRLERLARHAPAARWWLGIALLICVLAIETGLETLASHDVRDAPAYLFMYTVLGLAWLRLCEALFPLAGLSTRDDLAERGNAAARPAIAGALGGAAGCYFGGNIGDGPGWWVVVACATIATASYFAAWIVLDRVARVNDAVTIERDVPSGVRLAGYLVAAGLILGRAVAGDWHSLPATVRDFVLTAWPVVPLTGVAALLEPQVRPTPARPRPSMMAAGIAPALLYLAAALAYVVTAEWPE